MKLEEKDKKIILIGLVIGFITNIFIEKIMDLITMIGIIYFTHKYIDKVLYDEMINDKVEYIDRDMYLKKMKRSLILIDIYLGIKIFILIAFRTGSFSSFGIIIISQLILIYARIVERKYIKSVNGVKLERKIRIANNKKLLIVILMFFVGFTYNYYSYIEKTDEYIKSNKYEYKLSYNKNGQRIVYLSGDGFYQQAVETKENSKHFEQYLKDSNILLNVKILEDYSKVAMVFMFVLAFSQIAFTEKDKKNKSYPVIASVFLIGASIFGSIVFNTYYVDLESRVFINFTENGLNGDNEINNR